MRALCCHLSPLGLTGSHDRFQRVHHFQHLYSHECFAFSLYGRPSPAPMTLYVQSAAIASLLDENCCHLRSSSLASPADFDLSPADFDPFPSITMQNQCRALLQERDYIGLSETSSSSSPVIEDADSLQDTDLRLGLGLSLGSDCKEAFPRKDSFVELSRGSALIPRKRRYSEVADDALVYKTSPSWHGQLSSDSSSQDSAVPPPKGQVVGWPPVCSYRRMTLPKSAEMFVKVNMDGMTVGRKVDLSAYTSYESLLLALEEMFQPSSSRENDLKHFLLAKEPDFILTYEDKEGDWMLVGDVPWSMFTSTVKRLRITRGSEANGTVSRC